MTRQTERTIPSVVEVCELFIEYVSMCRPRLVEKRRTDDGISVFRWCLQTKKTPMVMLPREANAERSAAARVTPSMSLTVSSPTVALGIVRAWLYGTSVNQTHESSTVAWALHQ